MRRVVLVLIGLIIAPIAQADDYLFLVPSGQGNIATTGSSTEGPGIFTAVAEEESDPTDACGCPFCILSLAESFAPLILPPKAGEMLGPCFPCLVSSTYRPDIFHPPYA